MIVALCDIRQEAKMLVRDYRDVQAQETGLDGVTVRWVISVPEGAPNFAMRVFEVQPGAVTPHHQHPWEHEVFVVAGTGEALGEDGVHPLSPGTTVFVPPMEKHQFRNTGDEVLRFICVIPTVPEALPQ